MLNFRRLLSTLMLLSLAALIPAARAETDYLALVRNRNTYSRLITDDRDKGSCRMLRGDVTVSVILVSAPDAAWTLADMSTLNSIVDAALDTLEREAAAYHVPLHLTPVYYRVNGSLDPDEENWLQNTLSSIPALDVGDLSGKPLLFALNTEGRSFARTGSNREHVIFYMERDAGTIRHELLHLYGAEDFYFHPEVEAAAEKRFPDSIMLESDDSAVIDPFTAYLIGWLDAPDAMGAAFLDDIRHLSSTEVENARDVDQQTGTGMFELDSGTYYGTLEMGCANGSGLHLWPSGMTYVGDWAWNYFDGKGTLTWPDGEYYTGDFASDKRTGKGTYVWASGMTYTGDFIDGHRTGKGTLTWPDGDSYTGDFINGQRTGRGTYTWSNGITYTGDFVDNNMTGNGMMTFANGDIYLGQFENGQRHGLGTLYYADGTVQSGQWKYDQFIGE